MLSVLRSQISALAFRLFALGSLALSSFASLTELEEEWLDSCQNSNRRKRIISLPLGDGWRPATTNLAFVMP